MSDPRTNRLLAAGVAVLVVAGAVAIASQRADDETAAQMRGYYGEQWDVARHCLVGTPIGRRDSVDAIASQVESLAYAALAEREAGAAADETWPLSCAARVGPLRDARELANDPASDLAALDLAMTRMLEQPITARDVPERARTLAERVARLDATMPPGAEYDPARYPPTDPGAGRAAIARSAECALPRLLRRPFLEAEVGDETLHDERRRDGAHERLVGEGEELRLETVDDEGTHVRPLREPGLRMPRFYREALAWLTDDPPSVVLQIADVRADPVPLGLASVDRWALVGGHVIARGDGTWLVRTETEAGPIRVTPEPPAHGVVGASSDALTVLLWFADRRWRGVACGRSCAEVPALAAGGNLQLAVRGTDTLVVARGMRSALTFARRLDAEGWSAPVPVSRGELGVDDDGFVIEDCEGEVRSADGQTWTDQAASDD